MPASTSAASAPASANFHAATQHRSSAVLAVLPAPPPELREARRHGLRERRRRLDDPEVPRAVRELPAPVERVRGGARVLARQPGFDGGEDGARIARVPLVREARETRPRRPPSVVVLELPYQRHGAPVLALPERCPGVVAGPEGSRRGEAQVVGIAQRGARGRLQRRVVCVLRDSDVRRRAPGAGDAHRRHDFVRHRARLPRACVVASLTLPRREIRRGAARLMSTMDLLP